MNIPIETHSGDAGETHRNRKLYDVKVSKRSVTTLKNSVSIRKPEYGHRGGVNEGRERHGDSKGVLLARTHDFDVLSASDTIYAM